MAKKFNRFIVPFIAISMGLYPAIYFFIDKKFGLLGTKSAAILSSPSWLFAFYTHITLGGVALLIGWTQFNANFRNRHLRLHRKVGKVYVISVLISAVAAMYTALYATGGVIASWGFMCLAGIWFYTTLKAFTTIKNRKVAQHHEMMIYSYAATFSAVTFRIFLPILTFTFHDFVKAYLVIAWMCWVPNMIVAYFIVRRMKTKSFVLRPVASAGTMSAPIRRAPAKLR